MCLRLVFPLVDPNDQTGTISFRSLFASNGKREVGGHAGKGRVGDERCSTIHVPDVSGVSRREKTATQRGT